jgi:hypothetical protein
LGGWASFETQAVHQWFIRMFYNLEDDSFFAPLLLNYNGAVFWEMLDIMTLVFEIGIIFSIALKTAFRLFLFIAVGFHLSNVLITNIDFSFNLAFYILFLPWDDINKRYIKSRWFLRIFEMKWLFLFLVTYGGLFLVTEKSPLVFILNSMGVEYMGNALFRSALGMVVSVWAIYEFCLRKTKETV